MSPSITHHPGIIVPGTATIVGGGAPGSQELNALVERAADMLRESFGMDVTIRFNSNGRSGSAWLITDTGDGIGSNSDIGLCVALHSVAEILKHSASPEQGRQHIAQRLGGDPGGPDAFLTVSAHISNRALNDRARADCRLDSPWECYAHKTMPSLDDALRFLQREALHPARFPKPTHGQPMRIGRHEWRIRFDTDGTISYEWRRVADAHQAEWQDVTAWPSYNAHAEAHGCPASLRKLAARDAETIERHKHRLPSSVSREGTKTAMM